MFFLFWVWFRLEGCDWIVLGFPEIYDYRVLVIILKLLALVLTFVLCCCFRLFLGAIRLETRTVSWIMTSSVHELSGLSLFLYNLIFLWSPCNVYLPDWFLVVYLVGQITMKVMGRKNVQIPKPDQLFLQDEVRNLLIQTLSTQSPW